MTAWAAPSVFWDLNSAEDWEGFRSAVSKYHGPAQNMPYADVDGNIGYYTAGRIPIRANPGEGELPMPGWDGEHEWQGYVPFSQNPHMFNPESGYVVVANNRTAHRRISALHQPVFRGQIPGRTNRRRDRIQG